MLSKTDLARYRKAIKKNSDLTFEQFLAQPKVQPKKVQPKVQPKKVQPKAQPKKVYYVKKVRAPSIRSKIKAIKEKHPMLKRKDLIAIIQKTHNFTVTQIKSALYAINKSK